MKKKILNILSILFGLMFINPALNKIFQYIPVPEDLPEGLMNDMMAIIEIREGGQDPLRISQYIQSQLSKIKFERKNS